MNKLSKREKVMIGVLIALLVVCIPMVTAVLPAADTLAQNTKTLHKLNAQKSQIAKRMEDRVKNEEEAAKLQAEAKELYALMEQTKSYDISLLLSGLLSKHNLEPAALDISEYRPAEVPGKKKDENEGESAEEGEKKLSEERALVRTADLYFSGGRADVERFLDEITNYNKSVLVDGFTVSDDEKAEYEIRINFYEFVEPGSKEGN